MTIRGAIFDADGTLLDSMAIWDTLGEAYLRALGIAPKENLNQTFKNMSLHQAALYYQSEYGVTLSVQEIMDGVNRMIEDFYRNQAALKPGVPALLAALKARGVKMCVATATDRYLVDAAFARLGIDGYFDRIFTCTGVGAGKDQPRIFQAALDFLGTPKAQTWVFEDALYAARTAKMAGFPLAAVYDPYEREQDALRAMADHYLTDFTQAEVLLK